MPTTVRADTSLECDYSSAVVNQESRNAIRMPRQFFKRHMPQAARIRKVKSLRVLGRWIYEPNLWHISRRATAGAFFIGLFCAFIPFPTQMIFAAILAIYWRCNLPISVGMVWVSNPLTMPPIFYGAYLVGAYTLGVTPGEVEFEASWSWLGEGLLNIWQPLLLGCLICGLTAGGCGYMIIDVLWRFHVVSRWRARRQRKKAAKQSIPNVAHQPAQSGPRAGQESATPENTSPSQ